MGANAELRRAYLSDLERTLRRGAITYCLLAAAIIVFSIPLDRARFTDEQAAVLLRIRLAGALALVTLIPVVRSWIGERYPRAVALLPPTVAAAVLHLLIAWSGKLLSPMLV